MRSPSSNSAGRMPRPSMYTSTAGQGPPLASGWKMDVGTLPSRVSMLVVVRMVVACLSGVSAVCVPAPVLGGEVIEATLQGGIELRVESLERLPQLLRAAGAHDGCGDGGVREHPGEGGGRERQPALRDHRAQRFDGRERALVPVAILVALGDAAQGEARARRRTRLPAVFAGEEAACERVVWNHGQAFLTAERQ